jgi:hypothetical protein
MRRSILLIITVLGAVVGAVTGIEAQIGYPSPYPGSPYPGSGGQYPGSGGTSPNGSGGRGTGPSRTSRGRKDAPPTVTTTGMLRLVSGSQFVLEADDHRIITYKTTDRTMVEKDGKTIELKALAIADHLTVDSTADEDGYFTAAGVTFNLAGAAADREAAARTWDLPALSSRPVSSASGAPRASGNSRDDDDRPVLRRNSGGSNSSQSADTASSNAASSNAPQQAAEDIAGDRPTSDSPTTTIRPNDPPLDADDPGKPALRRGRPVSRPTSAVAGDDSPATGTTPVTVASAGSPGGSPSGARPRFADAPASQGIPIEEDPIIAKAKAAAQEYSSTLPNFFCRQVTTRYETDHPKDGWQAVDTVTADVAYENGRESYKNIMVGNKAVKATSMDQIPGSSSSGEFASILEDLFDAGTAASFRKSGQDTLRGRSAYTYKYEVKRENSHWRIVSAAQLYYPAYRGTVWIDRETSRVLRIEMESRNMPVLFPFDQTETATDYDFVRLSTPQQFLMPVAAEVLSCEQGSSRCLRNRIEFRNYRKFGAESDITFGN